MVLATARRIAVAGGLSLGVLLGAGVGSGAMAHADDPTFEYYEDGDLVISEVIHPYSSCEIDPTAEGCETESQAETPAQTTTQVSWFTKVLNVLFAPFRWIASLFG
ncbi:MAG: hypothetical protein Q3972_01020 [Corynebacterium sp.]|nr:hypothetical protein [Corynebacterium sp.]